MYVRASRHLTSKSTVETLLIHHTHRSIYHDGFNLRRFDHINNSNDWKGGNDNGIPYGQGNENWQDGIDDNDNNWECGNNWATSDQHTSSGQHQQQIPQTPRQSTNDGPTQIVPSRQRISVLGEPPLYQVPEALAQAKKLSHQVQPGVNAPYVHRVRTPKYIDQIDVPYAKFAFNYRRPGRT